MFLANRTRSQAAEEELAEIGKLYLAPLRTGPHHPTGTTAAACSSPPRWHSNSGRAMGLRRWNHCRNLHCQGKWTGKINLSSFGATLFSKTQGPSHQEKPLGTLGRALREIAVLRRISLPMLSGRISGRPSIQFPLPSLPVTKLHVRLEASGAPYVLSSLPDQRRVWSDFWRLFKEAVQALQS